MILLETLISDDKFDNLVNELTAFRSDFGTLKIDIDFIFTESINEL